jgi:hypothetical protein
MARRKLTVDRYAEIKRRLAEGRGVREIARALSCSRRLVREIRAGLKDSPAGPRLTPRELRIAPSGRSVAVSRGANGVMDGLRLGVSSAQLGR